MKDTARITCIEYLLNTSMSKDKILKMLDDFLKEYEYSITAARIMENELGYGNKNLNRAPRKVMDNIIADMEKIETAVTDDQPVLKYRQLLYKTAKKYGYDGKSKYDKQIRASAGIV